MNKKAELINCNNRTELKSKSYETKSIPTYCDIFYKDDYSLQITEIADKRKRMVN